ncbi:MAG TPA: response regulator transcription factor [Candidatus Acidoferrales bacterium]|nr:response regulator transcription factor [Candidatus Acidoferrales bacterium]
MKLLIADDSPMLRERLATLLSQIPGIELVGQAENGREAVRLAATLKPDIVVMDIKMPEKNGIEALVEIKKEQSSPRVVIFTSFPFPQHEKRCLELGAERFLDKSNDIDQLQQFLKGAVQAKSDFECK